MARSILHTDAIVLRAMDYRETSRIATLLTRRKGRMAVLAKGARRKKSSVGSCLQPLAHIHAVVHVMQGRELQTLAEAAHVTLFPSVGASLERLGTGFRVVELVHALTHDGQEDEGVFSLLLRTLRLLDQEGTPAEHVFPYFQLRLATALGFAPQFERAEVARLEKAGGMLALDSGDVVPPSPPTPALVPASGTALRAFAVYARADFDAIRRMRLDPHDSKAVARLIRRYIRYHTDGAYPDRSDRVLRQLRQS